MIISAKKKKITSSIEIASALKAILMAENEVDRDKEHFWVVGLNTKNVIQYVDLCSLGILNRSLVHPREVFRLAIMKGVSSIIVAHNHPSGEVTPSADDHEVTIDLKKAGEVVGITLLDHIIISAEETPHFSFLERGYI